MRLVLTLLLIATGSAVQAHPGHLADLAGHDHWVAGAAIGIAGLIAIIGAVKGKKAEDRDDQEAVSEEEGEPA